MKRLVSILLILTFGFAGASSIMHQLEQEEIHVHEEGTHLCTPDAHHHCSLCDTLITFGFTSKEVSIDNTVVWNNEYVVQQTSLIYSPIATAKLGRAPPLV